MVIGSFSGASGTLAGRPAVTASVLARSGSELLLGVGRGSGEASLDMPATLGR